MSKFNEKTKSTQKTTSYEGGSVFKRSLEDSWFNALFSSFLQPQFYESSETQQSRYIELTEAMISKYGPDFVGKAAAFSRNELGMRSISELTAAILNKYYWDGKRKFYASYFHRPDDVGEVFGAVKMLGDKRSHALVRGAGDYLSTLNGYKLMKYRMNHHEKNMYDLINVTHAHSEAIDSFKNNELSAPDTWESKIVNEHDLEKVESEWKRLIEEKKLGYLALIRNLKTICKLSFVDRDWVSTYLGPQLIDETKIEKSLVWPYQIYTAYKSIQPLGVNFVVNYLESAYLTACNNVSKLPGNTLFVLDVSGSMGSSISERSTISIKEASAAYLVAYALMNAGKADSTFDIIKFGTTFNTFEIPSNLTSPFKVIELLSENDDCGYGTYISPVFEYLINDNKKYDRIILFSDMQVMNDVSYNYYKTYKAKTSNSLVKKYKNGVSPECKIYSFDLGNYYNQLVSQDEDIRYITSLNNYVFKAISILESKKSLIDVINQYEIA